MTAVCISGIGIVSPLGQRRDANWQALQRDAQTASGRIEDFRPADYIKRRYLRPLDEVSIRCIAMTGAALQDAGIEAAQLDPARVGIVIGSMYAGIGCIFSFKRDCYEARADGYLGLSPLYFPGIVFNSLSGQPAIEYGFTGPNAVLNAGAASGLLAVIRGAELIATGRADVVIAGGAEMLHPFIAHKYRRLQHTPMVAAWGPAFVPAEATCLMLLHRQDDPRFAAAPRYGVLQGWRHGYLARGLSARRLAAAAAAIPGLDAARLGAVACSADQAAPLAEIEQGLLQELQHAGRPDVLRNKRNFGHCFGAAASLDLFHALLHARDAALAGPVLVSALDPKGSYAFLSFTTESPHARRPH